MIKINKEITIEKDNIFANDLFGRKEAIVGLTELIENQQDTLVLGINADWGAGKTTFVKLWQAYLQEKEVKSIYFSAWENDFSDEPLVAILGELNIYIESLENKKSTKTKKLASEVIKEFLPIIAKGVTSKLIGNDAVVEMSEKLAKKMIYDYKTNKNDLANLKNSIGELLNSIDEDKPFVIFIDELDRCKPLYAIELLERIKHIFDIERLIFVLSVDKNNLAKSIQSQYGNIDTDNYLRRFIHLEYPLKNPKVNNFCAFLFEQFELSDILNSKEATNNDRELDIMHKLIIALKLSIRQIEQIFTGIHIFSATIRPENEKYLIIFLFILLQCFKSHNSKQYYAFLDGNITEKEIDYGVWGNLQSESDNKKIVKEIISIVALRNNKKAMENIVKKPTTTVGFIYKCQSWNYNGDELSNIINTAIRRIDLMEKFNF